MINQEDMLLIENTLTTPSSHERAPWLEWVQSDGEHAFMTHDGKILTFIPIGDCGFASIPKAGDQLSAGQAVRLLVEERKLETQDAFESDRGQLFDFSKVYFTRCAQQGSIVAVKIGSMYVQLRYIGALLVAFRNSSIYVIPSENGRDIFFNCPKYKAFGQIAALDPNSIKNADWIEQNG